MTTRGVVDVVFCLDASSSMTPCIEGVKAHITHFVQGLQSTPNTKWDVRLDFVAHQTQSEAGTDRRFYYHRSALVGELWQTLYRGEPGQLFLADLEQFRRGLTDVRAAGDESPFVALDICLDFPWRPASACHRVVIMLTDEPFETGLDQERHRALLPALIRKIQDLRVMLYIVAPQSHAYSELSAVDRSEYHIADDAGNGLATVDFSQVLSYIGKSVSKAHLQGGEAVVQRGLFGQPTWRPGAANAFKDAR
jgi:hypothetical protein